MENAWKISDNDGNYVFAGKTSWEAKKALKKQLHTIPPFIKFLNYYRNWEKQPFNYVLEDNVF